MSNEENKDTLTLADQERAAHIAHGLAENPEVLWHDTIFKDLQWYYVEGGMYAVRRLENHKCAFVALVEAKEPFDAVAKVRDGTEWVGQSQLRHIGNAAAMSEAMETVLRYVAPICRYAKPDGEQPTALFAIADTVRDIVAKALSAPARQCDVGTAEEQLDRYGVYCQDRCTSCENRHYCHICGERYRMKCMMEWAQMPYKAEQKGEGK